MKIDSILSIQEEQDVKKEFKCTYTKQDLSLLLAMIAEMRAYTEQLQKSNSEIDMKNNIDRYKDISTFDELKDIKYGKIGTTRRGMFEAKFKRIQETMDRLHQIAQLCKSIDLKLLAKSESLKLYNAIKILRRLKYTKLNKDE